MKRIFDVIWLTSAVLRKRYNNLNTIVQNLAKKKGEVRKYAKECGTTLSEKGTNL